MHIVLNGTTIEKVTHTQFLGVTIDGNLTWREQAKLVETIVSNNDCQTLHTIYQ